MRWCCKYAISYRDLEETLAERGVKADHSTLFRWVQHYAPKILTSLKWYWKPKLNYEWHLDETYVKVKGAYLYRPIDEQGHTIDFYLSARRNSKAAARFIAKAIKGLKEFPRCST